MNLTKFVEGKVIFLIYLIVFVFLCFYICIFIEILNYEYPVIKLKITCGKGVYIRSLARDIGEKLKTGAYMQSLVRTRVGEFKLDDAIKLEE